MSDTYQVTPPATPSPPMEVPVDVAPTHAPAPIGSQAPPRPEGQEQPRPRSRRESIEAAFKKAEAQGRPGPAKPRMGHNQPPEETEKFDLRRPPPAGAPHRDRGRFARAPEPGDAGTNQPLGQAPPQGRGQPPQNRLPPHAPYRAPPLRLTPHARAAWDATPEAVRGDVYRMHNEFVQAHRQYQADREIVKSIRKYHDLATSQGTSLARALNNYTNMEHKLRTDLFGGLDILVGNLNLKTPDGRKANVYDVAWHILSQTPEQYREIQNRNQQAAHAHQIAHLQRQQNILANQNAERQYRERFFQTRGAVDEFARRNPRFDELGGVIEQELKHGYSLEQAYQRANLLMPTTHAAQTRTTPAQTRSNRSIYGAPDGGHAPRQPRSKTNREALARAMRAMNGSQ